MLLINQLKIIEEFLRDLDSKLTGSFIAKKKKLNQKTVANYLNKLEKENILESRTQGKNKLYYFNLQNKEIVKNFIMAVEHLRTINFYQKNILTKEISEKIIPYIKGVAIIFGSYAKNTQKKDSDIDIMVIGKCNEKEIDKISKMYGKEINLKIYPRLIKDILTTEVIKNHIIIKNTEKFIEGILRWKK